MGCAQQILRDGDTSAQNERERERERGATTFSAGNTQAALANNTAADTISDASGVTSPGGLSPEVCASRTKHRYSA
ncbi:hypothetical protein ON010_g3451 [Phytophthora cinnamomi]|nr:hypothetical protein ON010_g3451 [Phytophthora cinnamomi]